MGRNWRHVRTLTRKNCINWRRTWLGSFLELAIPGLIMAALCFYKINEQPETVPEEKLLHYATAHYPVTQQVGINFYPVTKQPDDLYDFLDFANITDDNIVDDFYQRYPQFFYPQHCYQYTPRRNPQDSKEPQIISGMNVCSYWIVNILFDILKMEVPMVLCCVLLYQFELTEYLPAIVVFVAYPIGVVPFTHATSFLFQTEWAAQFFTVGLNLLVMIFGPLTVYIFMFNSTTQEDVYFGDTINYWLRVIPSYNVSKTLLFCGTRSILERKMDDPVLNYPQDIDLERWSYQNSLGDIYALAGHFCAGCVLIIFFESVIYRNCWARCFYCICRCCFKPTWRLTEDAFGGDLPEEHFEKDNKKGKEFEQDDDVEREQNRVRGTKAKEMPVRVANLKKVFRTGICKSLTAVNNISFGLETGECFALLGVNGAGKTTVFKSLTNDTVPTGGRVSIGGWDVQRWFSFARKRIGYCPQHNCIFEQLTVVENLYLFARIKGVKWMVRKSLVNRTIERMNLTDHKYKEAGTLSGGNKRKLQVAIAIIGNPPIMLLDEPSSGMDPEARRFMWQVIAGFTQKRKQSAVILTTHSMEEAEALSTKMGIMVKGGIFKCFGSVQHIKNKFGTGYELELKIRRATPADIQAIMAEYELPTNYAKMTIPMFKEYLSHKMFPDWLMLEITTGGLGDELLREAKSNKQGLVRILHMIEWLHVIQSMLKIIKKLAIEFGTVEILNHHNSSFKFRVLRNDKTIGFLFGLIEDKKDDFAISEYSASQTTLEQIFQMFAHMSYDDDTVHLVFKYNEEYEYDLEIRKSTTIQSLYTNQQAAQNQLRHYQQVSDAEDEAEAYDQGHQQHEGVELQRLDGQYASNRVQQTDEDRSAFGTTQNLLLGNNHAVEMATQQNAAQEEGKQRPRDEIKIYDEQPSGESGSISAKQRAAQEMPQSKQKMRENLDRMFDSRASKARQGAIMNKSDVSQGSRRSRHGQSDVEEVKAMPRNGIEEESKVAMPQYNGSEGSTPKPVRLADHLDEPEEQFESFQLAQDAQRTNAGGMQPYQMPEDSREDYF